MNLVNSIPEFSQNRNLNNVQARLSIEIQKLQNHYEDLERLRLHLNNKIETIEQMELENLENYMSIEYRMKHSEEHKKYIAKYTTSECQTETAFNELL